MSDHDRYDRDDNEYEHGYGHDHERHAGNETVSHGPSENPGPRESSGSGQSNGPGASGAPGSPRGASAPSWSGVPEASSASGVSGSGVSGPDGAEGSGPEGLASDELALRRMLHQAVQEIEPADDDGTLERLRRAVPARRARKRQAVVGMAAAALFIGTAVPALLHVSNSTGPDADPSMAGHQSSQTQGGASQGGSAQDSEESGPGSSPGKDKEKDKEDEKETPGEDKDESSTGATGGAEPTVSAANAPVCTSAQLGNATSNVGSPDAGGAVYGNFRIANVSAATCTVTGSGTVSALPQGAADGAKIQVVSHTSGDAATGLPDPATEVSTLVLQPGSAYEVQFAWVPSETCPTIPDDPTTPDEPTPTDGTTTGGDSGGTTTGSEGGTGGDGTTTQLVPEEGVQDGSVVVSNTAVDGAPTTSATVPNACAGTVYRTGMLAAS
ncbi:hypothetical protein [Streptomyces flaveus]|uniref:DUF4232 domain-containing protein n=1 Tax=Streptomyces flaveus TaxID=66370 RepID=A0A917VFE1_9ACTN|nr:hypothetical protein [Streptomyces flaveus]GGK74477.1 hypothetical protein GCM10010094_39340 [Streptomyces flaveus]